MGRQHRRGSRLDSCATSPVRPEPRPASPGPRPSGAHGVIGGCRQTPTGHEVVGHVERPGENDVSEATVWTRARTIALRLGLPAQPVTAVPTRCLPVSTSGPLPLIDIGAALDLMAAALAMPADRSVHRPGPATGSGSTVRRYASGGEPQSLVGHVLALAGVAVNQLERLEEEPLRELWQRDGLPVRLTLGALVVLDAAQRRQSRGCAVTDILPHVAAIARCYVDLLPDRVVQSAASRAGTRPATHPSSARLIF
jgi:hypothetical protein